MTKIYAPNVWVDEALAGNERYNILEDGGGAFKSTMQIALATSVSQAGTPVDADHMNHIETGIDALDTILDLLLTGWIAATNTWTYVSATSFRITGDMTGKFQVGDKIKLTQTTVKYFYVIGVVYSSPNTTITVTGGSDYTLANAAITSPYYSKAASPQGFPQWFNYAHGWASSGTAPVLGNGTSIARFSIVGRLLKFSLQLTFGSTTTFGTGNYTLALPVMVSASAGPSASTLNIYDSSAAVRYVRLLNLAANLTFIGSVWGTSDAFTASPLTPTVPFTWASGDILRADGSYEI